MNTQYVNYYRCSQCMTDWSNIDDCQCDDRCPGCDASHSPVTSKPAVFEIARHWRQMNGYQGLGGVIVLYQGDVQSWVEALPDPAHWAPGCLAVDENGALWQACGGSQRHGAAKWRFQVPF